MNRARHSCCSRSSGVGEIVRGRHGIEVHTSGAALERCKSRPPARSIPMSFWLELSCRKSVSPYASTPGGGPCRVIRTELATTAPNAR